MKKLSALRARIEAIENEGSDRTLTGEDEASALETAVATEVFNAKTQMFLRFARKTSA